jgi:hypothetical protein
MNLRLKQAGLSSLAEPAESRLLMGLRPTKWDENPPEQRRRIFNRLHWAFDRAAGFQPALFASRYINLPQETLLKRSSPTRVNAVRIQPGPVALS